MDRKRQAGPLRSGDDMSSAIVGVGETPAAKVSEENLESLIVRACREALDDAGLRPSDVDGIVIEGAVMPKEFPADRCEEVLGLHNVELQLGVSKSGAGVVGSLGVAAEAIRARRAEVVLSYFGVDWGTQRRTGGGAGPANARVGEPRIEAFERAFGYWPQVVWFGGLAQRYLETFGRPESDFASWVVANRENAATHEHALEREPLTESDYMDSPYVAAPLRRADCSLLNDGAGAMVVTSLDRAADCRRTPVGIAGVGTGHNETLGRSSIVLDSEILHTGATTATQVAMRSAGIGLDDVGFAEIYDCFTIAAILQAEDMGLFEPGTAGQMAGKGVTRFDGALPINTHGGLLSNSFIVGMGHVIEGVRQVRRERGDGQVTRSSVGLIAGYGGAESSTAVLVAI